MGDKNDLKLERVLDAEGVQSLVDDFYKLTHIAIGIVDVNGKVLVSKGWQDICTKFHRVHPATCLNCIESDLNLTRNVSSGEFKMYKCGNNMWDISTPIILEGKHLGNIFLGQFIFDDEEVDYEFFRSQARKYGFDEEEYIAALDKVPRWSHEFVNTAMSLYVKVANMISVLNYKNIQLEKLLSERHKLQLLLKSSMESPNNISIVSIDKDYRYLYFNNTHKDIIESTYGQEITIGMNLLDSITLEVDKLNIKKNYERALRGGYFSSILEIGNRETSYEVFYNPMKDEEGKIVGATTFAIDITNRKLIEKALEEEKNLLETTLMSVGDGVISTDREGNVKLINVVAEHLTGWSKKDAYGKPLEVVFHIVDEFSREDFENPAYKVFDTMGIVEMPDNVLLISNEGIERPIEASTSPIKNRDGDIIGVVLVFRDFTNKKNQLGRIQFLSFHDELTGLYNRRFYEEEFRRLNTERNLPLSLVMADVNGLKLTNDAFGHLVGDMLLQRAGDVIKKECRIDDIVARIGGDEFVILLPKTSSKEAESIVRRITTAASKEKVGSMDLSISFGWATKTQQREELDEVFKKAEEYMYRRKLFESPIMKEKMIKAIINRLYETIPGEKEHSERVCNICEDIGKALKFSVDDIDELKIAALIHDIGKISIISTSFQWGETKKHPEAGYRILSSVNEMSQIAEYILAHHECWNGKGYPKGLKGEEIPFQARIIAIADTYDNMVNERMREKALSKEEAIEEIKKGLGTQFDPRIGKIFVEKVLGQ